EPALHADLTRDRRYLVGECCQGVRHAIDGFGECGDFTFCVHGELLRQFTIGHGRYDLDYAAHLLRQIDRHYVDVVGEILPCSGNVGHLRLSAELSFRTHFTRDARHFGGEGIQLVHHRIDGVFQLQNFAFDVDRDLARQIASSNGGRHFGDVAHLPGQVP